MDDSGADVLDLDDDTAAADPTDEDLNSFAAVDVGLSASDVLQRIEEVAAQLVADIVDGLVPSMQLLSRARTDAEFAPAGAHGDEAAGVVLALRSRERTRDILHNQGASAFAFARVFKMLEVVHELLREGRRATQRDIYYKLQKPPLFSAARDVNSAIQDTVALLRVPRDALGICCAARGAVSGCLYLRDGPVGVWQDCTTLGMSGRAIPGDMRSIDRLGMQCSARYLLVIEKDAVFQRLNEDRFFDAVPCVMITAKGMPDLATRAFARKLVASYPALIPLGLVDWNPAGLQILMTYKFGATAMGLESHRHALGGLRWLGVRRDMLEDVPTAALQPLTARDTGMLTRLRAALQPHEPDWAQELGDMEALGGKADIEALYHGAAGMGGLREVLATAILRGAYV